MNLRVVGYHGCDRSVALGLVNRQSEFKAGPEDCDWLGTGVYFWEEDIRMAWTWARQEARENPKKIAEPAVVGAVIDLTDCLNLAQTGSAKLLEVAYEELRKTLATAGRNLPRNEDSTARRYLDHAVMETLHELRRQDGERPFASVRAAFQSGDPVFPGVGIRRWDHLQICVRDTSQIEGVFLTPPSSPRGRTNS